MSFLNLWHRDPRFVSDEHGIAGTDAEDVIRNAFGCFDPDATGLIDEDR